MPIPNNRIAQFTDAWKQEFGETLSEAEARVTLGHLVDLYRLVLRPLPGEVRDVGDFTSATPPSDDPAPSRS